MGRGELRNDVEKLLKVVRGMLKLELIGHCYELLSG